jgi:hypothetical protein
MPTDGFDIKVYTVGPDYAHAGYLKILNFYTRSQKKSST